MDWILRNLPLFVFLFFFISVVRAVLKAREAQDKNRGESHELEEQRRIREVQEQIRRKIAERRGETTAPPVLAAPEPAPAAPAAGIPPVDPFGGGGQLRRVFDELQRRLQPAPTPTHESHRAELERQERLAEELQTAENAREQARRHAAHLAAERDERDHSRTALLRSARSRLLADLQDRESLRRAFVLREVLGPPVGLR